MPWTPLVSDPRALVDARLQLHWAAQIVSGVGATHLETRDDDSHPNLGWDPEAAALAGHPVGELRAAITPADLTLHLLDPRSVSLASYPLDGRSLEDGRAWMAGALAEQGLPARLDLPGYDLPGHAVANGAALDADPAHRRELAAWFASAHHALERIRDAHAGASTVRCWPHHFDIATLIPVAGEGRSVGVGMTPGDHRFPEPYWYVTPWPYPDDPELSDLPHGHWHTEGWIGAVLTGTDTVAAAEAQEVRVAEFLDAAVRASRALLEVEETGGARRPSGTAR